MACLFSLAHFSDSLSASLLLKAFSKVADRLIFNDLALFNKSLFKLRFAGFLGHQGHIMFACHYHFMRIVMRTTLAPSL